MAADEDKKRRKKKKKSRRKAEADEEAPLTIDQGEAEFANTGYNDDAIVVEQNLNSDDDDGSYQGQQQPTLFVQGDDDSLNGGEDTTPSPILEPDANGEDTAEFTQDGLAVAMAVDHTAEDEYIYAAIEYDPDSKPPLHKNRRFRVYSCMAMLVIIAVVVVVVVYVTKSAKEPVVNTKDVYAGSFPSMSPTSNPVTNREMSGIIQQVEAGILQRGANFTDMDLDDPRYLALDWILHHDQLQLDSDDVNLYQRYVLALLAFSLDSLAWYYCGEHRSFGNTTEMFVVEDCEVPNPGTGQIEEFKVWLSSTEECEWYGVICSQDEVVRGVELMGNDLIGEIPPEISQLRFLQYLALNGNCLYGEIPQEFGKMPNLLSLELHGNGLSGAIPDELYDASKLQLLNVAMQYQYSSQCQRSDGRYVNTLFTKGDPSAGTYNAGLSGHVTSMNVSKWSSMKGLHLFDNSFWGWIHPEIGKLKYLVFLRAQNNVLSSWLPNELTDLKKLREVYLSGNGITHDLPPTIGDMEDLEDFRVNENVMNGTIPESLYQLKKLKYLWLSDTLNCENLGKPGDDGCVADSEVGFTGTISTNIGNLKKLVHLLVNNNPIGGTLPMEMGECKKLAFLHIHKTNIGGSAPQEVCLLRDMELNNENNAGVFYADCRPNNRTQNPYFKCDCCSDCCDHTTKVCVADD